MDFSKEIRQRIIDFSTKACPDVLYLIHYFVSESFLESDVQVSENSNAAQDEIVAFTLNIGHPQFLTMPILNIDVGFVTC